MGYPRKVIDGHYHIEQWSRKDGMDFFGSTKEYQQGRGIHAVNLCSIPCFRPNRPSPGAEMNVMAALYKLQNPETYVHGGLAYDQFPLTGVMPEGMDPLSQYRDMMAMGCDGIKILETKPTVIRAMKMHISDPSFEPFFAATEADGTHFVWHVADPRPMWEPGKMYDNTEYPTFDEIYEHVFQVLERHPLLKVTFAHFFFMSDTPERLEEIFARYPNVNVDLTPGSEMFGSFGKNRDFYIDFFNRYADRLSYGTDATDWFGSYVNWESADNVYNFLTTEDHFSFWGYKCQGINLGDAVLDKILWQNFEKRVSEKPCPVNVDAVKAYMDKYRSIMLQPDYIAKLDAILEKL